MASSEVGGTGLLSGILRISLALTIFLPSGTELMGSLLDLVVPIGFPISMG